MLPKHSSVLINNYFCQLLIRELFLYTDTIYDEDEVLLALAEQVGSHLAFNPGHGAYSHIKGTGCLSYLLGVRIVVWYYH